MRVCDSLDYLWDPCLQLFVWLAVDLEALEVRECERLADLVAHDGKVMLHRLGVRMDLEDDLRGAVLADVDVKTQQPWFAFGGEPAELRGDRLIRVGLAGVDSRH